MTLKKQTLYRRRCLSRGGAIHSQFLQIGDQGLQPVSYMKKMGRPMWIPQSHGQAGKGLFKDLLKSGLKSGLNLIKPHIRPLAHKGVDLLADKLGGGMSSQASILNSLSKPRHHRRR